MGPKMLAPYFLLFLTGLSLILASQILMPFLAPLALAAAFGSILYPLYTRLRITFFGRENLAAATTLLSMLVGILIPLAVLISLVGWEASKLYVSVSDGTFSATVSSVLREMRGLLPASLVGADYSDAVAGNLSTYAREGLAWVSSHVTDAFSSIASIFLSLFIFFIALFFFLRDGEKMKSAIVQLSPLADHDDEMVFDRLGVAVNSVIKGNLLIALVRGIVAAVGFLFLGIPNPVLWGILAGLLGLIPGIGVMIVFIPAIVYAFFTAGWLSALGLLLWGMLVVGLVDNLLTPRFVGHGMQIHPLLVFLAVFGGISYYGPSGIFLGPLSLSLLFALLSIYSARTKSEL